MRRQQGAKRKSTRQAASLSGCTTKTAVNTS
nr:MAG TPA: hypothetical protein [Caudoviricetes sp.]